MVAPRRLADRYEIEEVLAKGGMGVVWRGRDLRLGRPVAVKLVAGDALTDPTVVARFDREARTVARLNHPNIVAIYDFGTDGGDSFLVMELVEGSSVAAVIADGPLPIGETLRIAVHACHGLAAAHAAGVVHRDVKPANLIRTPSGVVKICDFGIARLQYAVGQARLTGTAVALGSTNYMAPEQVNGDPVDARTDLYGLGCTIYAMLTGTPPFVGESPLTVVTQHVTQPPPDLRAVRPDVPEGLAVLVDELLAKSPDDRPSHAGAIAERLAALREDLAATEETTAGLRLAAVPTPGVPPAGPSSPPSHHGWIWGGAAAAVLAAIAVTSLLATRDDSLDAVTAPPSPTRHSSVRAVAPTTSPTDPPGVRPTRPSSAPAVLPSTSSPPRTAPVPPANPIVEMRLSIQDQQAAGQLEPKDATDLRRRVDDIAKALREGDDRDVAKKINDLRTKLTDLREHDRLTPAGYAVLNRDLDRIAAMVPPVPGP